MMEVFKEVNHEDWRHECYMNSIELIVSESERMENPFIAHGIVINQGERKGFEMVHSWVEDDNYCYDNDAIDNNVIMVPKELYYNMANMDRDSVIRYTAKDVLENIEETGHAGPWDDKLNNFAKNEVGSIFEKDER